MKNKEPHSVKSYVIYRDKTYIYIDGKMKEVTEEEYQKETKPKQVNKP